MLVKVLDPQLANMIAAGEVVERPSSVAKELCENAIDAGASSVTVEIQGGGLKRLSVTDNGSGIHPDDMETAFLRHATSKISSPKDLEAIFTLGFRGEALASIAAVAKVTMTSRMEGAGEGKSVIMEGGKLISSEICGCPVGTRTLVENLFYNTPARMKFLKKDYTEAGYVEEVVRKLALAHPEISFRFISDGKEKVFTPGDGSIEGAAYAIYGKDVQSGMVPVSYSDGGITVSGLTGNLTLYRKNRALQCFFVNNRCIVSRTLTLAVEEAYKGLIPVGTFPVTILKVEINPSLVDVNVHPAKLEVKFFEENKIYSAVYWAVKNATHQKLTPKIDAEKPEEKNIPYTAPLNNPSISNGSYGADSGKKATGFEYQPTKQEKEEFDKLNTQNIIRQEFKNYGDTLAQMPYEENTQIPKDTKTDNQGAYKKINDIEFIQTAVIDSEDNYKILGQLFNTYILVEEGDKLVLIDQHAAHERLIYEKLVKEKGEKQIMPQMLLVPEVVSLTPVELSIVTENKEFFENLGWELEPFGDNDIAVRAVPYVITKEQTKDTLIEIIEGLKSGKQSSLTEKEDRIMYTIACRSAIKGHDALTLTEMQELVKRVKESDKTITCPHGRPVSTIVTKAFIEKLFKRL
ncbi:MAG: DNA mismatch repair endonuclease MutL [Clostridia bacterium]|nr:DNA mismatch repair endonuclease MutL [Clostridia bacterium]